MLTDNRYCVFSCQPCIFYKAFERKPLSVRNILVLQFCFKEYKNLISYFNQAVYIRWRYAVKKTHTVKTQ